MMWGEKRCLEDERIYRAERHVIISDCGKGKTHSIQPASLHTPESSQLQRRSQRGFTFLHHAVHTGKWLSTTSTPITRQGQRDWMNLQNCQICGSGCAAPGIRFQGFYVLFMHAYRSMPFIVPSLHNSSEKLSCKLTSDLAIKKSVMKREPNRKAATCWSCETCQIINKIYINIKWLHQTRLPRCTVEANSFHSFYWIQIVVMKYLPRIFLMVWLKWTSSNQVTQTSKLVISLNLIVSFTQQCTCSMWIYKY